MNATSESILPGVRHRGHRLPRSIGHTRHLAAEGLCHYGQRVWRHPCAKCTPIVTVEVIARGWAKDIVIHRMWRSILLQLCELRKTLDLYISCPWMKNMVSFCQIWLVDHLTYPKACTIENSTRLTGPEALLLPDLSSPTCRISYLPLPSLRSPALCRYSGMPQRPSNSR